MGHKLYLLESLKLRKGDTFEFGSWKGKPIEWQVLTNRGGILCISKYCLDERRFDSKSNYWDYSELRQWLNLDFINKAFNSEENNFLQSYEGDKVTLLSIEEVERYFPSKSKRKGTFRDGSASFWWLRSRFNVYSAADVGADGDLNVDYVGCASGSVRPVIFLKKDVENYLEPEA